MIDLLKLYRGISMPKDEIRLATRILSDRRDKSLIEFYWFHLALNGEKIDGKLIEERLDRTLIPLFKDAYNKSFLLLKVWKTLVEANLGKIVTLPNLFLPQEDEKILYHTYKILLGKEQKRIERRWKEILYHLSIK